MNQDFTVKKSNICLKKKIRAGGFNWKKKIPTQVVREKKNSHELKIPHPPPITFQMVRPLLLVDDWICRENKTARGGRNLHWSQKKNLTLLSISRLLY